MTQDNEDLLLNQMTQSAANLAAAALHSYYKSARNLIIEGGHEKAQAVWQNPIWWCQMMAMVMLEEARRSSEDGKLPEVLSQNIRVMLDATDGGEALFEVTRMTTHTRQ